MGRECLVDAEQSSTIRCRPLGIIWHGEMRAARGFWKFASAEIDPECCGGNWEANTTCIHKHLL